MKKRWTKEEDIILIKYYSIEGTDIISRLKGRTVNAIKNRAQQLGLIYRQEMCGWTDEELNILKTYYPIEGKRIMARFPSRTLKTIQVTAFRHNIKRRGAKTKMRIIKTVEEIREDIRKNNLKLKLNEFDDYYDSSYSISSPFGQIYILADYSGNIRTFNYNVETTGHSKIEQYEEIIKFILNNWIKF